MSAFGQNSGSATTAPSGADSDRRKISRSQFNRNQQNVHSYLHDIPIGLMPHHNAQMTDKSKRKLVVRRLEQIFAGKRSSPGAHAHPIQQEEVAQSAARADRRAKEATGQLSKLEGHREARIMPVRSEDGDISGGDAMEGLTMFRPILVVNEQDYATISGSGSGSPDQRPTRPLDLDPYRAQIPVENMEYIRHLGFTPPAVDTGDTPEDGHGWIYLNLLINMAQLHTINVTPDFVKDAVTEYSSMLELSHDGRKIRWRGGHYITKDSSGSSSEHLSSNSPHGLSGSSSLSPTKRIQTSQSRSSDSLDPERQARHTARAAREIEQNKYTYTPIFFHKDESDDEDEYYNLDMMSSANSLQPYQPGDSSGFGSSAMRSSSARKKREDGPIIFYNRAKFCTDLSGDRNGNSIANPSAYKSVTGQPLGNPGKAPSITRSTGDSRRPGNILDTDMSSMDVDSRSGGRTTSSSEDMEFSPDALRNDTGEESPETMDFVASGLGGVQPDDNFQIKVKRSTHRTARSAQATASRKRQQQMHGYPKRILEALNEQASSEDEPAKATMIKEEILSASRKDLPSSTLPPASFLPFDSTSSGDVDSDLESDVSSSPSSTESSDRGPATALAAPQHFADASTTDQSCPCGSWTRRRRAWGRQR